MGKQTRTLLMIVIIMVAMLILVWSTNFVIAQTYTDVTGVVRSDTTWAKTNSPYRLTGPVAVNDGITLTIESGVQVYFNTNTYMQVNGTLVAKGSDNDPISFLSDGEIKFMSSSKSWNEKTGTGSIIENGNIPSNEFKITINGASPKIASSISQAMIVINDGSPLIFNNSFSGHITSIAINSGTPIISGNRISDFQVTVKDGSPVVLNNHIRDSYVCIEVIGGNPYILNNNITDSTIGISATTGVIERNYISTANIGIEIGNGIIRNNTITSVKCISMHASSKPTISYNNFEFGYVYGIKTIVLAERANQNVDAANNWWGTIDTTIISKSIVDNKNDFNLGTVNFVPFLTAPNPQAMPDPNAPVTLPSSAPSATPQTPEFPSIAVLAIIVIAAMFTLAVGYKRKTHKHIS